MTDPAPSSRSPLDRLLVRVGLGVWITCGAVLLASALRAQLREDPGKEPPAGPARPVLAAVDSNSAVRRYRPDYQLRTGDETVLVLVGGSFCGAHRRPGFPGAVESAKLHVQRQARATGRQFRAVGVSLDWKPDEALAFLGGLGEFDEMLLGGNWVGDGAARYVWRDMPGEPVVPQLIVVERHVEAGQAAVGITRERVLKRVLGADAIEEWVRSGAPL